VKTQWLGSLKGEERENFRLSVLNSKIVLDKLHEIVYNMYRERRDVTISDYSNPSWSHLQAHQNGACEALSKVLELLDIKYEEPTK
jgi:hypothetical protein